ncbi:MAG: type III polyketide synthase [candidate division KSB1 bacterium]|nr:type III polyketide synthase [candidate division KSB1 bacterium]
MPLLVGIETIVPPFVYRQEVAGDFARQLFGGSVLNVARLLPIFKHAEIEQRHFCMPAEWYGQDHRFSEKNRLYTEQAVALATEAVRRLCAQHRLAPEEIDHVFFVSSTGIATPSIDAHLVNTLPLRSSVRRSPLWGLGCAGGVAGLSRAADWLKAYPDRRAVVIALELCSLTFIRRDLSKSNFVATSLFADGAAAALLLGDACPHDQTPAIQILASNAITWRNSLEVMGWEMHDDGLKVLFSRDIPTIVRESARPAIEQFLAAQGMAVKDISAILSHPGGAKVIAAYAEALEIPPHKTKYMRQVLRDYGNMSSATVLFVWHEYLQSSDYKSGSHILATTLGPGFSTEMILGRCL